MERMWRRFQSWILGGLFLIVIVEIVVMAPKVVNEPVDVPQSESIAQDVQQSMTGIHVMETKSETREWEMWADTAKGMRESGDMQLEIVKAIFFGSDGSTFTVTGKTGQLDAGTKNMHVSGGVLTRSSNGYVFHSEDVTYDSENKSLRTGSPISIRGPKEASGDQILIRGVGMNTKLKEGLIKVLAEVLANKSLPQTGKMKIESQTATLSANDRAVQFSGNVVMDFSGVRVTGPDAKFAYDSKHDMLQAVELNGGVRVSDWSKWATSDKVKINLLENKYVFNGRPRVIQDDDELMGDEIIFLNGGKKVKVKNARIKVGKERLEKAN
jgi:LPS export ABC transporter protein LptC